MDYISEQYETWFVLAASLNFDSDQLLLVRGYVKTTQWGIATWTDRTDAWAAKLSAQGSHSSNLCCGDCSITIGGSEENVTTRFGPPGIESSDNLVRNLLG